MTTALYAGSFDPVHRGHVKIIEHVAHLFDEVVVAVLGNPAKPSGMFAIADRISMVEAAAAHLPNVRCIGYHGLAVDLARSEQVDVLVRAAHKETGRERSMAATNETLSGIQTFVAVPDPTTRHISSSLVRQLLTDGNHDAALQLVPASVRATIADRMPRTARDRPIGNDPGQRVTSRNDA